MYKKNKVKNPVVNITYSRYISIRGTHLPALTYRNKSSSRDFLPLTAKCRGIGFKVCLNKIK
jgi:hypothetical protein